MTSSDGWQRPSACSSSECIEVHRAPAGGVLIRNSGFRQPDGRHAAIPASDAEWEAFKTAVKAGEYD